MKRITICILLISIVISSAYGQMVSEKFIARLENTIGLKTKKAEHIARSIMNDSIGLEAQMVVPIYSIYMNKHRMRRTIKKYLSSNNLFSYENCHRRSLISLFHGDDDENVIDASPLKQYIYELLNPKKVYIDEMYMVVNDSCGVHWLQGRFAPHAKVIWFGNQTPEPLPSKARAIYGFIKDNPKAKIISLAGNNEYLMVLQHRNLSYMKFNHPGKDVSCFSLLPLDKLLEDICDNIKVYNVFKSNRHIRLLTGNRDENIQYEYK